jgi:hypothetical protein
MQGVEALLGTEVWPWITHTLTIGVIAGGVLTLGRIGFQKWRELPLAESRCVTTYGIDSKIIDVAVTVLVFNRSPASMLRLEGLLIMVPKEGVLFGPRTGQQGQAYYCGKDMAPVSPSAMQYPSVSARAVICDWPTAGVDVKIRVLMTPMSVWMRLKRHTISIKLPKTV